MMAWSSAGAGMTAVSPGAARASGIFGSCASDHFLNPLVGLLIEIAMIGILFWIVENNIWGRPSTDSEQNFLIGKKPFKTSLLIMTFPRRKFGKTFNIIREIRWLMAGFFAPQIPKQQFLIGFLVLSIVAWTGPERVVSVGALLAHAGWTKMRPYGYASGNSYHHSRQHTGRHVLHWPSDEKNRSRNQRQQSGRVACWPKIVVHFTSIA
jgi:hypothetical protein